MFERLSNWFLASKSANKAIVAPKQDWTNEELELLLWCEQHRALGRMELPTRSSLFQSALLAVDISDNQLLIDSPFPSPPIELILPSAVCKISFYKHQQLMQMQVRVLEHLIFQGKPALLVHIESKSFHRDRRGCDRISFDRNEAPLLRFQIPMADQLRASVLNLSTGGAMLNIFGKHNELSDLKGCVTGKLQLNDGVCVDVKGELKAVCYYRRPCQHTQMRVQFSAMSTQDLRKLALFLAVQRDRNQSQIASVSQLDAG